MVVSKLGCNLFVFDFLFINFDHRNLSNNKLTNFSDVLFAEDSLLQHL